MSTSPDASVDESTDVRALLDEMDELFDQATQQRCECLVAQGLLFDSVELCAMTFSQPADASDCAAATIEAEGTPEHIEALRCYTDHIRSVNECAASKTCQEQIDGACDAIAAAVPCGDSALELSDLLFEHCPDLGLPGPT